MPRRPSSTLRDKAPAAKRKRTSIKETAPINGDEKKNGSFSWCDTYPGSLPLLAAPVSKSWNLKLCSWNINGLRAWLKNGSMKYMEDEKPDVIGLQEIKCSLNKIPPEVKCAGYKPHWSSAVKEGYAGTGLYSKIATLNVTFGIGIDKHDTEGRVITAEYDKFFFVTAYVPNSGQGLVRLDYRHNEWNVDFANYLKKLDKTKPVIFCGDLNVAHEEIDITNPKSNSKSAGFTKEERSDFTKLLADLDFVDTYRALYPSREKAFTFWNYRQGSRPKNTGWRLDYFLVSKRLMSHVRDQEIRCGVLGSDHCPVVLYMEF